MNVHTCGYTHVYGHTGKQSWIHTWTHMNTFVDVYTCMDTGTHNHGYTWTVCGHTHTRVDIHTCVDLSTHTQPWIHRVDTTHMWIFTVWTHAHTSWVTQ